MMLDHLRHTLIPLSVGLLLLSCSSDEPAASGSEMKFDISAVSRSAVTTASNITGNPFALFGDRVSDKPSERSVIFENIPVTFLNAVWSSPVVQYWYNNREHSFVAIHPASVLSGTDAGIQYLNSRLSFSYRLSSDHSKIKDILVATHRRKYQKKYDEDGRPIGGTTNVVYFRFGHVMSRINLAPAFNDNVLDADAYIQFHRLELTGIKTKAAFNITPSSLLTAELTDDRMIEVTDQGEEGSLTIDFAEPKKVGNGLKIASLFDGDETIIMLPQNFTADSEAKITLSYSVSDDPSSIRKASLPLNGQIWLSGKSYTYNFSIDRTGILSGSTGIDDWEVMDAGNIDAH